MILEVSQQYSLKDHHDLRCHENNHDEMMMTIAIDDYNPLSFFDHDDGGTY